MNHLHRRDSVFLFLLISILAFHPVEAHAGDFSKVVVFVQGGGTALGPPPHAEHTFDAIKSELLERGFVENQFLEYSYRGGWVDRKGRWHPIPYVCSDTHQSLATSVQKLSDMIWLYSRVNRDTKVVIVGHSLGGLVGFRSLRSVISERIGNDIIEDVITLDSPLRGLPGVSIAFLDLFYDCPGFENSPIKFDLLNMYLNLGKTDFITSYIVNNSSVPVHTLGNKNDCIYNLEECALPGVDWTNSQVIADSFWTMFELGNDWQIGDFGHHRILEDPTAVSQIVDNIID